VTTVPYKFTFIITIIYAQADTTVLMAISQIYMGYTDLFLQNRNCISLITVEIS